MRDPERLDAMFVLDHDLHPEPLGAGRGRGGQLQEVIQGTLRLAHRGGNGRVLAIGGDHLVGVTCLDAQSGQTQRAQRRDQLDTHADSLPASCLFYSLNAAIASSGQRAVSSTSCHFTQRSRRLYQAMSLVSSH